MNRATDIALPSDPFQVLGLPDNAGEEDVRIRYLDLVKQFPPDREPERFREIHAAYTAAKDPLVIARQLLSPPSDDAPSWSEVIDQQRAKPPRLSVDFLLSLGNRDEKQKPSTGAASS
jgi:hypothetical protein